LNRQLRVGIVGHPVLPRFSGSAGVQIEVGQAETLLALFPQQTAILVQRLIETGFEQLFCLGRGQFDGERLQWADFGQNLDYDRQNPRSYPRLLIADRPLFPITGLGEVVDEGPPRDAGTRVHQILLLEVPRDFGHLRDYAADRVAVGPQRQIQIGQQIIQLQRVGVVEGPLQDAFGHLETDEIVIGLRRVAAARHLQHVEAEFHADMGEGVLFVGHRASKSAP